MNHSTRRDFIKTTTTLLGIVYTGTSFTLDSKLRLSFSTLGCPDWSFEQIIKFATENNYDGIELRGIQRQMDLTKCPEFNSPEKITLSRKLVEDQGLQIADLGSSAELHHEDLLESKKNLAEAKRFIDLAHAVNCPFIRVFPNNLPKEQERNKTIEPKFCSRIIYASLS